VRITHLSASLLWSAHPRCGPCHAAFILNTILTFLSITGVYGHTNAELSRKYQSLATPAGWAFAIWGLIFLLEAVFTIAQATVPAFRASDEVRRAGPWFIAACCFQAAWSVAFGMEHIVVAQVLIVFILFSLWRTNAALQGVARHASPSWARYLVCYLPFTIHFGWLTAASIVSINLTLVAFAPQEHTVLLIVAVLSLTAVLLPALSNPSTALSGSDPGYALTIAWGASNSN